VLERRAPRQNDLESCYLVDLDGAAAGGDAEDVAALPPIIADEMEVVTGDIDAGDVVGTAESDQGSGCRAHR
jgi:hypothetical protein